MSETMLMMYVFELYTKFTEMELCKIKNPAFSVIDIWRDHNKNVIAIVDDLRAIREVGEEEDGRLMYMGIEWKGVEE